ncbi:hypothetical protein N0V90_001503 [Kalmusia sp. IMI 367209]|nr:hypothetical protein N0V90_001503 [Kalmusia sp. IMI 367209]
MSISITTGLGSLINLGIGAGDLAIIYSTGRRVGNWLTASSGDADFLDLLQEDEHEILRRRGIFDLYQFNKKWGQKVAILINGKPSVITGDQIAEALPALSRFTAIMVIITASLDEFMGFSTMKQVLLLLLKLLIQGSVDGQDIIESQIQHRVNAWRSAARVRGLPVFVREMRSKLIADKQILHGLMPDGDVLEIAEFLQWLLAGSTGDYYTNSSDVAGIAMCLSSGGFSSLGIKGLGKEPIDVPCQLVYTEEAFMHQKAPESIVSQVVGARTAHTAIPLTHPAETFFSFPITSELAMSCRVAWECGAKAATGIRCTIVTGPEEINIDDDNGLNIDLMGDILYRFSDSEGTSIIQRARSGVFELASSLFPILTQSLLAKLDDSLRKEDDGALAWLTRELKEENNKGPTPEVIESTDLKDASKIRAFTVFQAFFMGFYYSLLLQVVDTSDLVSQVVEGNWGYRSKKTMVRIRAWCNKLKDGCISRERLMEMSFWLLSGEDIEMTPVVGMDRYCLGAVGKRTLVINSLVGDSDTPEGVAKLRLLDVDTSGIPTDPYGIIRPGRPKVFGFKHVSGPLGKIMPSFPTKDWTKHIIPDFEGDPNTILLCFRYQGRQIGTINPNQADAWVTRFYKASGSDPTKQITMLNNALECSPADFIAGRFPLPTTTGPSVLVQVGSCPCMRYAAIGFLAEGYWDMSNIATTGLKSRFQSILYGRLLILG